MASPATQLPAELFEDVFLYLDDFDILAATAVCQFWRRIVENSKRIRHKLLNSPVHGWSNMWRTNPWYFRCHVVNGKLFVLRLPEPEIEVFLFASTVPNDGTYLRVLDSKSAVMKKREMKQAAKGLGPRIWIPDLEWTEQDGRFITGILCKASPQWSNWIRSYLLMFHYGREDLICYREVRYI